MLKKHEWIPCFILIYDSNKDRKLQSEHPVLVSNTFNEGLDHKTYSKVFSEVTDEVTNIRIFP